MTRGSNIRPDLLADRLSIVIFIIIYVTLTMSPVNFSIMWHYNRICILWGALCSAEINGNILPRHELAAARRLAPAVAATRAHGQRFVNIDTLTTPEHV